MNDRHRRIARLKKKECSKGLLEIVPPIIKFPNELFESLERLGYSATAARNAIEQMCRPWKVELEDFEKLTEVMK
jgi:Holliday junction resolvasome RuvABC DNA-binding subunit